MGQSFPGRSGLADAEMPIKIAVLAFEGVRPFQLSVPCEVFGEAHTAGDKAEVRVCSIEGGPIRSSAGFMIETMYGLDDLVQADVVFIPSWKFPHEQPSSRLVDALQSANARGAIVAGLCRGAFVLADAGLLNGKRATTHWAYARDFRKRFPQVDLDETQLYVDEGQVVTSAGVAAGIDCCLHLAKRLFGAQIANSIARNIVAPPLRSGDQAQYFDRPIAVTNRDQRLRDAMAAIIRMIGARHTINTVARKLGMSRRSFTRHFQKTTGQSFREWLADQRLVAATQSLEATSKSIEQIAIECGYGSAVTFRARFIQRHGVSPSQWRKAFHQKAALPVL